MGDGLEMYVVLAKGRDAQELESIVGVTEVSSTADGERVFIVQRDLKKD